MIRRSHSRLLAFLLLAAAASCVGGCTTAFGPGYTIEKQEIHIQFLPNPEPHIRLEALYQLKNTGNQPLSSIDLRLPGRRRFRFVDAKATWDGTAVSLQPSSENVRNDSITLPQPWLISSKHALHLSVEFQPAASGETSLSFSSTAFFLPSQSWSPDLLPERGEFATGGVPPKKWELQLRVPDGFFVHTSGEMRTSKKGRELFIRATQSKSDRYPFVIAGKYSEAQINSEKQKIHLWTQSAQDAKGVNEAADALTRMKQGLDAAFGTRVKETHSLWIVECPVISGCFTSLPRVNAEILEEAPAHAPNSELASSDTIMVDMSAGTPQLAAVVGPPLAASWLGYGQSPGFYEQQSPLSALPAFAAAMGSEAVQGPEFRTQSIRRALREIPAGSVDGIKEEDKNVLRAKGLLFFYALQDRYGRETFRKALSHMLDARRGGGFDLDDLISAFDQETHQNTAEFVRLWMKHPGVPNEFRARYEATALALPNSSEESTP